MTLRNLQGHTTVGCTLLHAIREVSQHVLWLRFVMVDDSWAIHNRLLAGVQLQEEHSGQRLIRLIVKLNLKGHCNIIWGAEDPKLLILPVVDLAWFELATLLKNALHCFSNGCREEILFKLRKLGGNLLANSISFFPYLFVLCANCLSLFFAHGLFDLYFRNI